MAKSKEEREQRRLEAKERSEKRKALKAAKLATATASSSTNDSASSSSAPKLDVHTLRTNLQQSKSHNATLPIVTLPTDALSKLMKYLPAREFGAMLLTCSAYNGSLPSCRASHLCSRLMRREDERGKSSGCGSACLVGGLELCSGRREAMVSCLFSLAVFLQLLYSASVSCTYLTCSYFVHVNIISMEKQ